MASREERKRLAQFARNLAATRHLYRVSLVARVLDNNGALLLSEIKNKVEEWSNRQHDFEY